MTEFENNGINLEFDSEPKGADIEPAEQPVTYETYEQAASEVIEDTYLDAMDAAADAPAHQPVSDGIVPEPPAEPYVPSYTSVSVEDYYSKSVDDAPASIPSEPSLSTMLDGFTPHDYTDPYRQYKPYSSGRAAQSSTQASVPRGPLNHVDPATPMIETAPAVPAPAVTSDMPETQAAGGGSFGSGNGGNGGNGGSHSSHHASRKPRATKKPSYVTKKVLAVCMIISILLSSCIGAAVGALVTKNLVGTGGGGGVGSTPSLDTATNSELTIAEIIDKNRESVVEINTTISVMSMFGSTETQGAGSGVIIRDDGYIVTNYHVIEGSNSVTVRLCNADEYSAQIVGYDQQNDIAILKIDGKGFNPVDFGESKNLTVGDLAVAIGNPLGQLGGTATSGIISALDRKLVLDDQTLTLLQTDSAINPGNSGGGLFDGSGNLIGIVVAKSSGTGIEGLGFAIPIDTAKPIIDDIIDNGKISTKPAAGIVIAEVTEDMADQLNLDTPGVYISEVNGENARKGGLEEGDRIVRFEGEAVRSSSDLIQMIQKHKIGDEVEFIVERDGTQVSAKFKLEDSSKFEEN